MSMKYDIDITYIVSISALAGSFACSGEGPLQQESKFIYENKVSSSKFILAVLRT